MVTSAADGSQVGSGGLTYAYKEKTFTGVDRSSYSALSTVPVLKAVCRYLAGGGRHPVVVTYGEGTPRFQYTTLYGIPTCSYDPTAHQSDRGGANFSSYLVGVINKANWKPSDPGTLVAWVGA
jgi:(4-O-methyl)-D-glucuronate---lignin esterase